MLSKLLLFVDEYVTSNGKSGIISPVFDLFHYVKDICATMSIISFTPVEFTKLWMALSALVPANSEVQSRINFHPMPRCTFQNAYCV